MDKKKEYFPHFSLEILYVKRSIRKKSIKKKILFQNNNGIENISHQAFFNDKVFLS